MTSLNGSETKEGEILRDRSSDRFGTKVKIQEYSAIKHKNIKPPNMRNTDKKNPGKTIDFYFFNIRRKPVNKNNYSVWENSVKQKKETNPLFEQNLVLPITISFKIKKQNPSEAEKKRENKN
ncbi:hypothetical protein CWI39_0228p0020 [Hamiltosporidium magnivora]|uniref:Uncharacterized protein n=1 Tax=Hamiltosporidium magnivora TaxID=148818 RepID=A0A4Q9LKM7_9MICR|nr:hypothetical protein CWI39_0228p0020 [Hamiltosporidium magnivora]